MNEENHQHRAILQRIAHRVMLERGLRPDFSAEAMNELAKMHPVLSGNGESARDLRGLLWASIDNDDSLDLDQLSVAEALPENRIKLLVAVADVDALVKKGSAIDEHARYNTTSIYTAAEIFPMLPERLSTDLTSLAFNQDRLAVVIEMIVNADGVIESSSIYRALVHNHAKLAYHSVAIWLDGGAVPEGVAAVQGLAENLRLQDAAAQHMKAYRHLHGALSLESVEARPIFDDGQISDLKAEEKDRAKELIENFMIAANGITAHSLADKKYPSIRRVVRTPKRWDRIVEIADEHGARLPELPDSRALEEFLVKEKATDPLRFPDLSLSVIKLLGAGEYVAEPPDGDSPGHFGLAMRDYAHSTAPNRRYSDLVTQRLLKAAIAGKPVPYTMDELAELAAHCTQEEDVANKVERQVGKSAAALLLENKIGETFDAIVTGASPKGTWVRLLSIPVEGKLVHGFEGADVGQRLHVQLISVDVDQGFIDFVSRH
jgi:VacB/RNase II family 3'-5' exoribonuclease